MDVVRLYTIGHSAHKLSKFIGLLDLYGIRTVVDVRSVPASRFYPQFAKRNLSDALEGQGIRYIFMGQVLGGRPPDPSCYEGGVLPEPGTKPWPKPDYTEVVKRSWFVQGIDRLLRYAAESPTAILCSEEHPLRCHRHLLIARYLAHHHPDTKILHIRGNGTLLSEDEVPQGGAADRQLALL